MVYFSIIIWYTFQLLFTLFFVFWALFFRTEPYKFALYPTFSLLLFIYFKNITNFAAVNLSII